VWVTSATTCERVSLFFLVQIQGVLLKQKTYTLFENATCSEQVENKVLRSQSCDFLTNGNNFMKRKASNGIPINLKASQKRAA
jgi:hypothetical protein